MDINEAEKITEFKGKYRFLSNSYPCLIVCKHGSYSSVEHAYQATKSLVAQKEWSKIKDNVMRGLIFIKFLSNPYLEKELLDTGKSFIQTRENPKLGKILMEVRDYLMQ